MPNFWFCKTVHKNRMKTQL
uniref:Uncharacterized protein n=1 Tax=Arundo donax TaxID=35708 RepID=A0A0A9GU95_ARUDO